MTTLFVLLAVLFTPSLADARWIRLTSEHFVFVGDAGEGTIRTIADRLELFYEVISRIFSTQVTASPVPTVVIVFQNARTFAPYRPTFNGKPVDAAGYFSQGDDVNYVAVNAEQDSDAHGLIFHEYTHFLLHNALGDIPPWADEGLAEFYETFSSSGARSAMIGMPNRYNLRLLQESTLLPLPQLIAVAHDSPMYNEGNRRGVFYAQSWALVHYLSFGGPARANQLRLFLLAASQGSASADAFTEAFGSDTDRLQRELFDYVRRIGLSARRFDFEEKIATAASARGVVISDQEAAGYLGELIARNPGRVEEARAFLQKAIDSGSDAARATASLGRLEQRAGNDQAALGLLERAVSLNADLPAAQRSYGRLLWDQAERAGLDGPVLATRARTALARAHELEPDSAATAATLARIELENASGAERAVALMRRVVQSSPAREDYRFLLAEALVAQTRLRSGHESSRSARRSRAHSASQRGGTPAARTHINRDECANGLAGQHPGCRIASGWIAAAATPCAST